MRRAVPGPAGAWAGHSAHRAGHRKGRYGRTLASRSSSRESPRSGCFIARIRPQCRAEHLRYRLAVERWSQRGDAVSRAFRAVTPVAFWVPVVGVTAVPLVWADESEDGHRLNAAYARNTAAALALGFVASRTAKHFIRRARPCTGEDPGDIAIGHLRDSTARCPAGSHVSSYSSFFSEHTMALFAIAAATSFQAQRRSAPNAGLVTVATFSGASLFSVARIYQRHHWLSDVLVGAAVGTASGFAAAQLVPAARRR